MRRLSHADRRSAGSRSPAATIAGGFEFKLPGGGIVRSANITPDADTGIGTWTEQQFVDKFKAFEGAAAADAHGRGAHGEHDDAVDGYAGMTREDLARDLRIPAVDPAGHESGEEAQLGIRDQGFRDWDWGLGTSFSGHSDFLYP